MSWSPATDGHMEEKQSHGHTIKVTAVLYFGSYSSFASLYPNQLFKGRDKSTYE